MGAAHELVAAGMPESAPELGDLLQPIAPLLKATQDPVVARVLSFVEQRAKTERITVMAPSSNPDVAQLAQLIAGRTIVMIGGNPRLEQREKIEAALECTIEWLVGQPHQSYHDFTPAIARPEVALVLLLIRWSSHGFGEISGYCRQARKPLVRVPSGYGVNMLAHAVLNQASQQLSAG